MGLSFWSTHWHAMSRAGLCARAYELLALSMQPWKWQWDRDPVVVDMTIPFQRLQDTIRVIAAAGLLLWPMTKLCRLPGAGGAAGGASAGGGARLGLGNGIGNGARD